MDVSLGQGEPGVTATVKFFPEATDENASTWQSVMGNSLLTKTLKKKPQTTDLMSS